MKHGTLGHRESDKLGLSERVGVLDREAPTSKRRHRWWEYVTVPCVMALSTTYRESHSLKWTARVEGFYVGGALILSGIVYHIALLFM